MKRALISVAILGGFWGVLLGIGFLTGALPPGAGDDAPDGTPVGDPTATSDAGAAASPPMAQGVDAARAGADGGIVGDKLPDDGPFVYDGPWSEPGCDPLVDVGDLRAGYEADSFAETARALAERRYPIGVDFIEAQRPNELRTWFVQGTDSFDSIALGLDTAVHEGAHIWAARRLGGRYHYRIAADLTVEARRVRTFHRAEIKDHHVDPAADSYVQTYLEGTSGRQGFDTLLDEYNAYAHSLASRYCTRDLIPSNMSTSARDGILTMMYYVAVYLRIARTAHTDAYGRIQAEPAFRRVILDVWERARFWLEKSAAHDALGVNDATIAEWTFAEDTVAEIDRVRQWEAAGE